MLLISVLALLLSNDGAAGGVPSEIVVVAKSRKCDLSSGGRTLRNTDFKAYAAEWAAGQPVRIVVPRAARTKCLAKIMFKLHDHGVTQAEFVDIHVAMPGAAVVETVPVKAN